MIGNTRTHKTDTKWIRKPFKKNSQVFIEHAIDDYFGNAFPEI